MIEIPVLSIEQLRAIGVDIHLTEKLDDEVYQVTAPGPLVRLCREYCHGESLGWDYASERSARESVSMLLHMVGTLRGLDRQR